MLQDRHLAVGRRRVLHVGLLVAAATLVAASPTTAQTPATAGAETPPSATTEPRLQRALQRTVDAFPGRIGVQVRHLESGLEAGVDADTPYPMASTFKVPVIVEVMARVDAGDWSLEMPVELAATDQHIGSGLLQDLWAPGVTLSLRNLATMMVILSDNSATDMLLERVGPAAVTHRMRDLGLDDIRVDRTTLELILDYLGVSSEGLGEAGHAEIEARIVEQAPDDAGADDARERFYGTPLDVASARDMTRLLTLVARGEALAPESCELILEIMKRTRTGRGRLRGRLPDDAVVAHKTGTIGRVVDDVGILYLPDDLGRVAISVFTLGDPGTSLERSEEAIADLARTAWDFFLFR